MTTKLISLVLIITVHSGILFSQLAKIDYIGFQTGTLGLGLQVKNEFNEQLHIRLSATYGQINQEKEFITAGMLTERNRKITSGGIGLTADWKAFENLDFVRLSGGLFYHLNKFYEKRDFTDEKGSDFGMLQISVYTFPVKPYMGVLIGKNNPEKKLAVFFELGTFFQGRPQVDFYGTGKVKETADQNEIIQENLKNYLFFPNINLQLNYKIK